jgi:hypothetical protein
MSLNQTAVLYFPFYILRYKSNYMELSPPGEAANVQLVKEFSSILWNQKVHYCVHKRPPHWSLSWARENNSVPTNPISLSSILILSTHLHLILGPLRLWEGLWNLHLIATTNVWHKKLHEGWWTFIHIFITTFDITIISLPTRRD